MCDYCGCRRQSAIDELSEEHERLLDLLYRLRGEGARGDHAAVVRTLETAIAPLLEEHTDKEERGLFVQLREAWAADDRLRDLVDEHRDIEERVATVLAGGPGWQDAVRSLGDALSEHILDEETDLFPYALYELTPHQWDAVEAVHDDRAGLPATVSAG